MSRKLFEKVKQAGKYIKKPFNPNVQSQTFTKSSSKINQQPKQRKINKSFESLKSNFDSLKDYAKQSYSETFNKQPKAQFFSKSKQTNNREDKKVNLSDIIQKSFDKVKYTKQSKQFLAKKIDSLKQDASKLSASTSEKLSEVGKTIANQKDKISDLGEQVNKKLSLQAEKIKKDALDKINAAAESKLELFGKLLNRMFWKIAMLIGIGLFAYGVGTSLPRQIRLHLKKLNEKESGVTSSTQNQLRTQENYK